MKLSSLMIVYLRLLPILTLPVILSHARGQEYVQGIKEARYEALRTEAWTILVTAIHGGGPGEQFHAVKALTLVDDPKALELLVEASETGVPAMVRVAAVQSLAHRHDRPQDFFLKAFRDRDNRVRLEVLKALVEVNDKSALQILHAALREDDILPKGFPESFKDLSKNIAFQALRKRGKEAVPILRNALKSSDEYNRRFAAALLGQICGDKAVPLLRGAIEDASFQVRFAAAQALARLGEQAAVPVLEEAYKTGDPPTSLEAAVSLYRLGVDRFLDPILEAMRADDEQVRYAAVTALRSPGERSIVPLLHRAITDSAPSVRSVAIEMLRPSAGRDDGPALQVALSDSDESVRTNAALTLINLGSDAGAAKVLTALALTATNDSIRRLAVSNLTQGDGQLARETLVQALGDHDVWVREAAVKELKELGDKSAAPLLESLLHDSRAEVVMTAADAIVSLEGKKAVPVFESVMRAVDRSNRQPVNPSEEEVSYTRLFAAAALLRIL